MQILFRPRIWGFLAIIALLGSTAFGTRDRWLPLVTRTTTESAPLQDTPEPNQELLVLTISPQARKNLGLISKPVRLENYSKKIQIPGVIVDQPGRSDRGITSPVAGVVARIHAYPGDTVHPGDRLFTISLFSEYLQKTQKDLFAATAETQLIREQLDRLRPLARTGGIAKSRIIELENNLRRQAALIKAHRQDLSTRGLNPSQLDTVSRGQFVTSIDVVAPPPPAGQPDRTTRTTPKSQPDKQPDKQPASRASLLVYEVQDLSAELGHQVRAGELLSTLANHMALYIEGHAFKREAPALETVAQNGWEITVEFAEDDPRHWPALEQTFQIRHLANSIDTASRTFDFFIPLTNQSRTYQQQDLTFIVWRFRPGQRVRLHVPVEQMKNVLVLPTAAVVREGPEAYVFLQNGDLFNRIPVQVLHEDRLNIVLANDGSLPAGLFIAQNSAASLNRVLKAQSASGKSPDVHVHADGTVHSAH
jgi:cobalt-zinc-cadmium efflux system membrane fusion protein